MDAKRQKILRLLGTLNRSKRVAGPGFGDANLLPLVGQCPQRPLHGAVAPHLHLRQRCRRTQYVT